MANVDMKVECNWQFSLYGLPIRSCGTSWLQVGLAEKGAETALHKHQTLKHSYAVLSTQKWPHSDFHHTKNTCQNWLPTDFISSPLTVGVDKDAKWVGFRGGGRNDAAGDSCEKKRKQVSFLQNGAMGGCCTRADFRVNTMQAITSLCTELRGSYMSLLGKHNIWKRTHRHPRHWVPTTRENSPCNCVSDGCEDPIQLSKGSPSVSLLSGNLVNKVSI
jgi:hypothetical protein